MYTICDALAPFPASDEQYRTVPSSDRKYISAPQILQDTLYLTINIVRLRVHLPHQHIIANQSTTLTAYFKANADGGPLGEEARNHTYHDFPQFFVYNPLKHEWRPRQQRNRSLGRMDVVKPPAGELFYLRLLLDVVKGRDSDPLIVDCQSH